MATGTSGGLLEQPQAQTVFKHELLKQYVVVFATKTASRQPQGRAVVVDGYAGRGRYPDHRPASAEHLLRAAETALGYRTPRSVEVLMYERDAASFRNLEAVTEEYTSRGVRAQARHCEVQSDLPRILEQARGTPLFMFLDPCGANLPFDTLVEVLGQHRKTEARCPPTEALLNFSADLTRRVGGHLTAGLDSAGLRTMDSVCGGSWWRSTAEETQRQSADNSWREAVTAVAEGYGRRLCEATSMGGSATPVSRRPGQQPLYHLVHLTRNNEGQWVFSNALAKARTKWVEWHGPQAEDEPDALFALDLVEDFVAGEQRDARAHILSSLRAVLAEGTAFRPVDRTGDLLGDYFGRALETTVNAVIRDLIATGEAQYVTRRKALHQCTIQLGSVDVGQR